MYSRGCPVPGYGLAVWPWARYWTSLCLLFCKMGIRTCLHELLQKVTLWLPSVHRSVTTWEQSEHTTPFLLNPQYFPCSAGVWWCLVGLCPGNRVSWQQRISAGCAGGLGLLIPLSDVSTSIVQKYQNPCQGKIFFFFLMLFLSAYILFIYVCMYVCMALVSVRGLSPVVASGGHSSSRHAGLSLSRPLLLRSTGSRRAGSVIVAHGPSCSAACGILPDQGSNPCPLHWQADSQPLRHQGSPVMVNFMYQLD